MHTSHYGVGSFALHTKIEKVWLAFLDLVLTSGIHSRPTLIQVKNGETSKSKQDYE